MPELKDIASEYIRTNFNPDDRLALVLIHRNSGVVTTRVSTAAKIASPEYQSWLKHMNSYQNRQEVYISMNNLQAGARGRTKAEIGDIRHVYLDFDENGAENLKTVRARPDIPEPNHILSSSPGKFQVVWRVQGFGKEQAEQLMRGMSRATGADIAATDCA
ncbi:MAG TPA: DNA-primase RepB domain-containing protein, partial [Bryobacteraceae bacterium]|nr:DNA-primase RepB domain-containing protein [Bryobacteraceae bacterium]